MRVEQVVEIQAEIRDVELHKIVAAAEEMLSEFEIMI